VRCDLGFGKQTSGSIATYFLKEGGLRSLSKALWETYKLSLVYLFREEKKEELETPRYRDRATERREDQNPD
jgi:hypothetical protein